MVKTDNDGDSVYRSFCDKDKLFKMLEQYVKQAEIKARIDELKEYGIHNTPIISMRIAELTKQLEETKEK